MRLVQYVGEVLPFVPLLQPPMAGRLLLQLSFDLFILYLYLAYNIHSSFFLTYDWELFDLRSSSKHNQLEFEKLSQNISKRLNLFSGQLFNIQSY